MNDLTADWIVASGLLYDALVYDAERCSHFPTQHSRSSAMLKRGQKDETPQEAIGIIISQGDRREPAPRFAAFVWGPVPDADLEPAATKAA